MCVQPTDFKTQFSASLVTDVPDEVELLKFKFPMSKIELKDFAAIVDSIGEEHFTI